MNPPRQDASVPRRSPAPLAAAGIFCAWLLLALTLWRLPSAPGPGLDPSWQLTLAYSAIHTLQFGTDVVFTYGPLGYLLGAANIGELFAQHVTWQFVSSAAFAAVLLAVLRPLARTRAVIAFVFFLLLLAPYSDLVQMAVITAAAAVLLHRPPSRWFALAIVAALAFLALIKFTNLLLIGFSLAVILALNLVKRRWTFAAVVAGGFAAAFVLIWLCCGQAPGHLAAFLKNSAALSGGYAGAMALFEPPAILLLGLASALSLGAGYWLAVGFHPDRPRAVAQALVFSAASFVNWKHGFTRADAHVLAHFVFALFIALTFPTFFSEAWQRARRTFSVLLFVAAGSALTGIFLAEPAALTAAPKGWATSLVAHVRDLAHLTELPRIGREHYRQMSEAHPLPAITALVGRHPVDVLGHEQGYAIFNRLNFHPRPVFQSYSAYRADLLRLNEAYYLSPAAPEFVLQKIQTIDGRLPVADDALVVRALYRRYTYAAEENGFLLWRKNPASALPEHPVPLSTRPATFNETIAVPVAGENPVWVEIELQLTLLGRLRALFYKPPLPTLVVTDNAGTKSRHRFIVDMGRAGFLAAPYLPDNFDVTRFEAGASPLRLSTLSLELPRAERKYFQRTITYRFSSLAPFPRTPVSVGASAAVALQAFGVAPAKIVPTFPLQIMTVADREVVLAHPWCEIAFDRPGAGRVRGGFGFVPGAYAPPNFTDGAEFALLWTSADGTIKVLWQRLLQPAENASDRGPQSFDVELPAGPGQLTLRTAPGPRRDVSCDWTYWTGVTFSN